MIAVLLDPITILLATVCLQWVTLGELGPFTLLFPYATLALVGAWALTSRRRVEAIYLVVRESASWLLPLAIFLLMTTPLFLGTSANTNQPRQIFFLVCSIALAACIATSRRLGRVFRLGAGMGLLIVVGLIELLARRIGVSWLDAIESFFIRGDLHYVLYRFLTPIFNAIAPAGDHTFPASTKNTVAGCVLVLALLFRGGSAQPQRDVAGMLFLGGALFFLLMLNDRSVILAAGASLVIATAIAAFTRPTSSRNALAAKLIGLAALFIIVLANAPSDEALGGTLSDRFAFNDRSTEQRLDQFQAALEKIQQHPFAGNGFFEVNTYAIHNLFLGAWAYAGIIAFLLVVIFYFALLAGWITFLIKIVRQPDTWMLPLAVEWIAPLPFMPLFRVWISSEGGVFKMAEWLAIAAFLGCVVANDLRRRAVARQLVANQLRMGMPASSRYGLRAGPGLARRGPAIPS